MFRWFKTKSDPDLPDEVRSNPASRQILRVWKVKDSLVCVLSPDAFVRPGGWGIALADAARHVANALHEASGIETVDSLTAIRKVFNDEFDKNMGDAQARGYFRSRAGELK